MSEKRRIDVLGPFGWVPTEMKDLKVGDTARFDGDDRLVYKVNTPPKGNPLGITGTPVNLERTDEALAERESES